MYGSIPVAALGVALLCLASNLAQAQSQRSTSNGALAPARTNFTWSAAAGTKAAPPSPYNVAMARGEKYATQAATARKRIGRRSHRDILARHAIKAYELAARINPTSPEPHLRAAEMLNAHFLRGTASPNRFSAVRAIRHWDSFIKLAPLDPRIDEFIFRRSIVFTRMGRKQDLQRALGDYSRLLRSTKFSTESAQEAAQTLSNMAEVHMMLGQLDKAIAKYARALDLTPNKALYGYGLAVALDRDGQSTRAREIMLQHAQGDRLRDLRSGGVFFVPAAEIYYYLALGYEVLGRFDKAITHYQRFINSRAHPKFQPRARQNLNYLRKLARTK